MRGSIVRISGFLLALHVAGSTAPALAQFSVATNPGLAPQGRYVVVRDHTQVFFSIMHLGLSPYYGRFAGASGTLTFNPLDPTKSSLDIAIDPKTASTLSDQISRELCRPDVFSCAKFSKIAFKSTAIMRTGDTTGEITGDLTIAGVTKPATLHTTFYGGMQGPLGQNNYQLGFSAETIVKRSDFGLTKMIWSSAVGDEIKLMIAAEFEQDKK